VPLSKNDLLLTVNTVGCRQINTMTFCTRHSDAELTAALDEQWHQGRS